MDRPRKTWLACTEGGKALSASSATDLVLKSTGKTNVKRGIRLWERGIVSSPRPTVTERIVDIEQASRSQFYWRSKLSENWIETQKLQR